MSQQQTEALTQSRDRVIIRTSVIGILANLLLAGFKAGVGLLSSSIAVVLDAVNNLSDALSSVITIVGTVLAGRKPDKKHPLGYGRIEYLSAMIVAALVLYAGLTSLLESVKKIITPEAPDYSIWAIVILAAGVAVKLVLGLYVRRTGRRVNSGSLTASGTDALSDAILSTSVLVCALVYMLWGLSLEAYVGVVISGFIIKSGVEMLLETLDELLGRRVDRETLAEIKKTVCQDEAVSGAYDLILHNYGPDRFVGSVHVEVPDSMTAEDIDTMSRRIAARVYQAHGVLLEGIGVYSVNTGSDRAKALRAEVTRLVGAHEGVLQTHGFYVDEEAKTVHLDVVLDFAVEDRQALFHQLKEELEAAFPDYRFVMALDIDF